jgi:hypothetical protein
MKKTAPVVVEIIFKSAGQAHRIVDPVRMPYVKADLLCVETQETDDAGRHIIVKYPLCNIFSVSVPHRRHRGMGPR